MTHPECMGRSTRASTEWSALLLAVCIAVATITYHLVDTVATVPALLNAVPENETLFLTSVNGGLSVGAHYQLPREVFVNDAKVLVVCARSNRSTTSWNRVTME